MPFGVPVMKAFVCPRSAECGRAKEIERRDNDPFAMDGQFGSLEQKAPLVLCSPSQVELR
jgi:hypothetical protein